MKNKTKKQVNIPEKIIIPVYYAVENGVITFDIESMEQEFDMQVAEMKVKYYTLTKR